MLGLRQRILKVTSKDEANKLLDEGKTYEFASIKTRNAWKSAARRALNEKPPVAVEEVEQNDAPKKMRKRKK